MKENVLDVLIYLFDHYEAIDLQQLKWVVLMVLLNQLGKEAAFGRMEDMVLGDVNLGLH